MGDAGDPSHARDPNRQLGRASCAAFLLRQNGGRAEALADGSDQTAQPRRRSPRYRVADRLDRR
jgi:hypothetical protein